MFMLKFTAAAADLHLRDNNNNSGNVHNHERTLAAWQLGRGAHTPSIHMLAITTFTLTSGLGYFFSELAASRFDALSCMAHALGGVAAITHHKVATRRRFAGFPSTNAQVYHLRERD